ncbi:MAG: AmmeMemoRadiSam system radical SAM enzyme [Candidatus Njordarchaeia archaeon]
MKKAILYRKLEDGRVECRACPRYCKLKPGQIGMCGVRKNINGDLYLLVYGRIITAHIDPIEKKPLTHFMPGSSVFSIATTGCNWICKYCQNYDLSQRRKVEGWEVTPELLVKLAKEFKADGFAYTYNEPTIFIEFSHDVGVLAHKEGLFNTFVTNGYFSDDALEMAVKFLDAATVDLKGNAGKKFLQKYAGVPDPQPIFDALVELKKHGVFIEITDLIVPEVGDNLDTARKTIKWIYDNLGPETPLHFLRFHPDYLMRNLPWTPIETLIKHWELAKEIGMQYVYVGNVPGHELEHTYCPRCGKPVIKRYGFDIIEWNLDEENRCKFCGYKINIRGKLSPNFRGNRFQYIPLHLYANYSHLKE